MRNSLGLDLRTKQRYAYNADTPDHLDEGGILMSKGSILIGSGFVPSQADIEFAIQNGYVDVFDQFVCMGVRDGVDLHRGLAERMYEKKLLAEGWDRPEKTVVQRFSTPGERDVWAVYPTYDGRDDEMVELICPACNQQFEGKLQYIGREHDCPVCGRRVRPHRKLPMMGAPELRKRPAELPGSDLARAAPDRSTGTSPTANEGGKGMRFGIKTTVVVMCPTCFSIVEPNPEVELKLGDGQTEIWEPETVTCSKCALTFPLPESGKEQLRGFLRSLGQG